MEWIKKILEKHTKEDGKVDVKAAMAELKTEFPKNAVPKEDFNNKVKELTTANETLEKLKKEHKDVEVLQTTITEHEKTIKTLKTEQKETQKRHILENAIKEAGGTDVDYLIYKLGEVDMDETGQIKHLENRIKDLQADAPKFFEEAETNVQKQTNLGDYKPLGSKLPGGTSTEKDLTTEMINAFTADIPEAQSK